ncbi:MAG TPA: hypothetical protein VF331_06605 [Polyangiales bacterium]
MLDGDASTTTLAEPPSAAFRDVDCVFGVVAGDAHGKAPLALARGLTEQAQLRLVLGERPLETFEA